MKIKSQINLWVDLSMFLSIIPVFITKGEVHKIFAYWLGIMIFTHLVLHAKQFYSLVQVRIPLPKIRTIFISTFSVLCISIVLFSMALGNKNQEGRQFRGRPSVQYDRYED